MSAAAQAMLIAGCVLVAVIACLLIGAMAQPRHPQDDACETIKPARPGRRREGKR